MAASGSGLTGIGASKSLGNDVDLDKTMEGLSLGSMDDDVTEKGKGRVKEEGDVLKSLLFETVSRLGDDEKLTFMREMSRKLDMGNLKKQGVQFSPEEYQEDGSFRLDKDFLTDIPVPSIYSFGGHSGYGPEDRSQRSEVKPVKIKPADKGLVFKEGDDIERFLGDFEDAAYIDGASDLDKCIQVKFFIPDKDMKTMIESMEGYRKKSWVMLKRNMMEIWGAGLLPLYTLNDLDGLCDQLRAAGGIKNYGVYVKFQTKFRTMLNHLYASNQIDKGDSKIIAAKYYRVFSKGIRDKAKDVLVQDGDLMPNGRIVQMPSILTLEKAFKKVLMTMNAWANMSLGDDGMDVTDEGTSCGNVLNHFKTRRQVNMGAVKSTSHNSAEMKELKKKLEAALKENDLMKARKEESRGYGGYQRRDQDGRQENSKEAGGSSTNNEYNRYNQPYICHYCSIEGHGARMCAKFKEDEANGLVKFEGRNYVLPDGKVIPWNPNRPIRTVVADYSSKNAVKTQEIKTEDSQVPTVKTSVGKLDCWNRPAVSSSGRVSFEVDMARKESAQPIRRSSRLNRDWVQERDQEPEETRANEHEESVRDVGDRSRFSTPEWDGPPESQKSPSQSTPRSILKKGATIEDLVDQDLLILDDDGLGIRDPGMVQAERNKILKDVFIDSGRKTRKPSYVIPSTSSRDEEGMGFSDVDGGLDIVLQKIFETKVTLTIKELTAISPALAKAVSEGNLGDIQIKDIKKQALRSNAGKLVTRNGKVEAVTRRYCDGELLDAEDVYSFLQSRKLGLYSCPLGFVEITFSDSGKTEDGLVDSGSQINLMTEEKAYSLGLRIQVNIKMKLTGISNNEAALTGIVENVPIVIAGRVWGKAHFWISNGDVPLILGRPFLVDFEANLNFSEKYGETLSLVDGRGMGLRMPTCDSYSDEWMRTLPGKSWEKIGGWPLKVNNTKLREVVQLKMKMKPEEHEALGALKD